MAIEDATLCWCKDGHTMGHSTDELSANAASMSHRRQAAAPMSPQAFVRRVDETARYIAGRGLPLLVPGHYLRMARYLRDNLQPESPVTASLIPSIPVVRRLKVLIPVVPLPKVLILVVRRLKMLLRSSPGGVALPVLLAAIIVLVGLIFQFVIIVTSRLVISALQAIRDVARTSVSAVPALVATIVIVFLSGDTWRILGQRFDASFGVLAGLFVFVGLCVLGNFGRVKDNLKIDKRESEFAKMIHESTPTAELVAAISHVGALPSEDVYDRLGWLGRVNVFIVYVGMLLGTLIAIMGCVAASLIIVGVIRIDQATTAHLMGEHKAHVLWHLPVGHMVLTRELLLLSLSLGALAALSYVVISLQDSQARACCRRTATAGLRRVLAAYAVYNAAWDHQDELTEVKGGLLGDHRAFVPADEAA